ncbi:ObirGr21 [Vespula squamosa]|uniref:Gustatory receptor n=1 Tax=Vespula squamosa TaxID=30214 RepID=A0ABD2AV93_VESSQ
MATVSKNLADTLSSLELILKFFALGNFENLSGKLNLYFNNLYVIIVWLIYFSIAIYLQYHKYICQDIIGFIMFNSKLLSLLITVISLQYYKQTWKRCLDKITMINDTLERLHIPNKYQSLHNRIKRNILVWILISIIVYITQLSWYKDSLKKIETYLLYMASIFERINKYILHLTMNKNNGSETTRTSAAFKRSNYQRFINTSHHKQSLLTIMHVHLELSKTCYEFHETFQIQLTFEMMTRFIYILGFIQAQYIYFSFTLSYMFDFIPVVLLIAVSLLKVIFLNNTIEKCCTKAKYTEHVLHILRDFTYDSERQEEIFQFILQITQTRLRLSGWGLFDFGHHFVYKYFMTIIDYIVIIEQLNDFSNNSP